MSTKLSDKQIAEILRLREEGKSYRQIGAALGVSKDAASRYCTNAKAKPPDTGTKLKQNTATVVNSQRWVTEAEVRESVGLDDAWVVDKATYSAWDTADAERYRVNMTFKPAFPLDMKAGMERYLASKVQPIKKLPKTFKVHGRPHAVVWGLFDVHFGMYAWGQEVGENYDIDIATRRVTNSVDDMIEELHPYNISKMFIPIGNDLMHFDGVRQKTTMGDHQMDTDSRYPKAYCAAAQAAEYQVKSALQICDDIDVAYVPGNHDQAASFGICHSVSRAFANDPRVKVDLGPSERKYRSHGETLLVFDHGKLKPIEYILTTAREARQEFAMAKTVEVHLGHRHQREVTEIKATRPTNGVTVRVHPALCNMDQWHSSKAFLGEALKSCESFRYDEAAFRGSHSIPARDD